MAGGRGKGGGLVGDLVRVLRIAEEQRSVSFWLQSKTLYGETDGFGCDRTVCGLSAAARSAPILSGEGSRSAQLGKVK